MLPIVDWRRTPLALLGCVIVAATLFGCSEKSPSAIRKAAEQGDPQAQFILGLMYKGGDSVPQDYKEATAWLRKAAEQGVRNAQFSLGLMYEGGDGVPQDYKEAAAWLRKAAEQGDRNAQFFLGHMYERGKGVPVDYVIAYMLYNLAAVTEDSGATFRGFIAKKMTPSQIEKAQTLSSQWKVGTPLPTSSN